MAEILIVEDELSINELIRKNLSLTGHHCTQVFDGKTAAALLDNGNFDLLVLDIMLPGMDGYQVFERASGTPVIFLTAKSELSDKLKGLAMGADDYMTKPFQMLELAARVEAVLRRIKKAEAEFVMGDLKIDFDGGTRMIKKIFFVALILFHVFFNSMILIVSNVILRDKFSVVRQQCLAEHYVIASSLIGDMQALEQRGNSVEENIGGLMRLYSRYLQGKGNGLAVSFSGEWIYESQSYAVWPEEKRNAPPDTGYRFLVWHIILTGWRIRWKSRSGSLRMPWSRNSSLLIIFPTNCVFR